MAKAQRRAEALGNFGAFTCSQDVGRSLQEQLELLAELRRQSRSAEAEMSTCESYSTCSIMSSTYPGLYRIHSCY